MVLLAIELLLAQRASAPSRLGRLARRALFILPVGVALSLRVHQALSAADVLDWDETYYLSAAVTAAHGHGLYPYVFGYGPMTVLGGFGYAGYLNAIAVRLFGPTLFAVRAVSLLGAGAGLAGLWRLIRTWYGADAAWIGTALTAVSGLFFLSNTARMDSWTFAWVAWALVLFATAFRRWDSRWPHAAAGFVFALGLEVHPDVAVTAVACGVCYAVAWIRTREPARRSAAPPLLFLAGWCAGLVLFIAANVLPDPHAFYRTTLLTRMDATRWYSAGATSVAGSFADPRILLAKERVRYALLASVASPIDVVLFLAACAAVAIRRLDADRLLLAMVPAVIGGTAILLNNASPLYYIHVAPILFVPLGPLFTRGIWRVRSAEAGRTGLLAFAVAVAAASGMNESRLWRTPPIDRAADTGEADLAARVRRVVDRRCKVAGDATLYARYFADYPFFISTRATEVEYAMRYYGDSDPSAYWVRKRPDVVVAAGSLPPALAGYVSANGFVERAGGVWVAPSGCAGGP